MSREIKFRAWCETYFKEGVFTLEDIAANIDDIGDNLLNKRKIEWMQFTGLLDKNGKEIYEGDIVRAYTYFDEDEKELCDSTVHVIEWGEDYPAFEMKPAPCEDCNSLQNFASVQPEGEKIEVIGNIHETPELLGAGR